MRQSSMTPENTLVKVKTMARVQPDAHLSSMSNNTKGGSKNYKFSQKGEATLPLE